MTRVIQIRDVPDHVHSVLVDVAAAEGLSLTKLVLRELQQVAGRAAVVTANRDIVRQTQASARGRVARNEILHALREGRGE